MPASASTLETPPPAPRYAEVAVKGVGRALASFTYAVPPALAGTLRAGHLVLVPFRDRLLQGLVLNAEAGDPGLAVREVEALVEPEPVLSPTRLALARWLAAYYLCPLVDAASAMLPPGMWQRPNWRWEPTAVTEAPPNLNLTGEHLALGEAIRRAGQVSEKTLAPRLPRARAAALLRELERAGLVRRRSVFPARPRPRTERWVELTPAGREVEAALAAVQRAPRQALLLEALLAATTLEAPAPLLAADLLASADGSAEALSGLKAKGLVRVFARERRRDPLAGQHFDTDEILLLTPDQARAWSAIEAAIRTGTPDVFLLHGVTGSGKTEIYLRAVAAALRRGSQAIVLVPEISLTPQMIARFGARFPGLLALRHSGLTPGEVFDEWRRIRSGQVGVVLGSRSALFAPLPRLGVIVIDEEHDGAYKQDQSPRYHARDAALKLAALSGAVVILGSATPDVATYQRAREGKYRLLELPQRLAPGGHAGRVENVPLPPVQIVDLRQELRAGNRGIFSRALTAALRQTLARGEQAILFLNRRGTASHVLCRACGHVLACPRCHLPLTYHASEGDLVCHHCGRQREMPLRCPACMSRQIRHFGSGTQKVEDEVHRQFPAARVVRWDRDSATGRGAHEHIYHAVRQGAADVLVGTQMLAKGLDLPRVTLVGIVNADVGLFLPDFRATERTFALLTQVAGRAGRRDLPGRAILQTYHPDHYCIRAAAHHDYLDFFRQESTFRHQHGYPPYGQLVELTFAGTGAEAARATAEAQAAALREHIAHQRLREVEVVGPVPAFFHRLGGRYRWQLYLRGDGWRAVARKLPAAPGWTVDVDPMSVL